jgi:hypothetical protein
LCLIKRMYLFLFSLLILLIWLRAWNLFLDRLLLLSDAFILCWGRWFNKNWALFFPFILGLYVSNDHSYSYNLRNISITSNSLNLLCLGAIISSKSHLLGRQPQNRICKRLALGRNSVHVLFRTAIVHQQYRITSLGEYSQVWIQVWVDMKER